ncbi:MAG TPA: GDSL-type esterase/lipase family protein [Dongiaceae bacterium]|nr:GDSL-type esterase/lipase family protein [Dongiaceae bacterium]
MTQSGKPRKQAKPSIHRADGPRLGGTRGMLPRLLIAIAYCIGLLAFFEASARIGLSNDWLFTRATRGMDDASYRLRFIHGRSKNHLQRIDMYDPIRGWALLPGLRDVRLPDGTRVSSNSRGLRGTVEYSYDKPPGVLRILTIGDSFTFGEQVGDDETWSSYLQELLPGTEVINLGVHGYGHDQMLLYLEREGVRYHPDIVILGFLSLDMERNLFSFRDYAKPRFVLQGGRLVLTNTPVPTVKEVVAREPWRSKLVDLLAMLYGRYVQRSGKLDSEKKRLTAALLDEIARTIRAAGAVPVFAYLPAFDELTRPEAQMTDGERFFFAYCRERKIRSVHLQRYFHDQAARGVALKTTEHWSPREHLIAAKGIRDYLIENRLVPIPRSPPSRLLGSQGY